MPYIKQDQRNDVDSCLFEFKALLRCSNLSDVPGMITYAIYALIKEFFLGRYANRALGIGCLQCVIQEIYRREHGPYEDTKIAENGDI